MSALPPIALAGAGLGLVTACWAHYIWLFRQKRLPARPLLHLAAMALGSGLAVAALVLGGSSVAPMIVGVAATGLALLFLYFLAHRRAPPAA